MAGVDLHGDERLFRNLEPFVEAFRDAAAGGLGIRAHAGEAAGPESVWDCLQRLQVRRIAHGVRAIEDPRLVAHLAREGIVLDLCPTSNVKAGAAASVAAHPIRVLRDAGITVTVSSDDPLPFATTLTDELLLLHRDAGFSLAEIGRFEANAAAQAFQPAAMRTALTRTIERAWPDGSG